VRASNPGATPSCGPGGIIVKAVRPGRIVGGRAVAVVRPGIAAARAGAGRGRAIGGAAVASALVGAGIGGAGLGAAPGLQIAVLVGPAALAQAERIIPKG
jgi:hypothetical protein